MSIEVPIQGLPSSSANTFSGKQTINQATATNALQINQTADAGNSTSTGGALNITNTSNDGAGLVIYTNNGATANGILCNIRSNNAAFDQKAFAVDYAGTTHAALIEHKTATAGSAANALAVVSANTLGSAMGITGVEEGHGTLKIVHNKPAAADTNAAAISIEINGSSTACQGIFIDSDQSAGTTGDLLDFRKNNGATQLFVVDSKGAMKGKSAASDPTATEIQAGYWDLYKNTTSGAVKLWYNDGGTLKSVALT